jgi:hypothetical protein
MIADFAGLERKSRDAGRFASPLTFAVSTAETSAGATRRQQG